MQSSKNMMTCVIGWAQEKDIFKLEKIRERKSRDLNHVKCIDSHDQKILLMGNDIKERWREYFNKLLTKRLCRRQVSSP